MQNQAHGAETVAQYANTYDTIVSVKGEGSHYYQERPTESDLQGFVGSVERNHGYYIGRYEASYGSGSQFGVGDDELYYKPASKKTTANSTSSMNYAIGTLWNFVTRPNAMQAGRQMYHGNSYVESDLVNSYMWDTAILYIQAMGNANYANAARGSNTSLKNTGETGDVKCNIYDMAGNVYEWTTEYYTYNLNHDAHRGGSYLYSNGYAVYRDYGSGGSSTSFYCTGFRVGLWLK